MRNSAEARKGKLGWDTILSWWPEKSLEMALELNAVREIPCEDLVEEWHLGSRNSMCKGPKGGAGLASLRNSEKAR